MKTPNNIKKRLEYLRSELRAEKISYDELAELQSLAEYIKPDDTELLEAAEVPEFEDTTLALYKNLKDGITDKIYKSFMYCTICGTEASGNKGDYFMIDDPEHAFKHCGETMQLVEKKTIIGNHPQNQTLGELLFSKNPQIVRLAKGIAKELNK